MASKTPKILYVEEHRYMHELVRTGLKDLHCGPQMVRSIQAAEKCLDGGRFDLILCEATVGDQSGIEFVSALRKKQKHAGTAVVVLSQYNDSETINRAMKSGADEYILKPFEFRRLTDSIKRWLSLLSYDIAWDDLSPEQAQLTRLALATMGQAANAARNGEDLPIQNVKDNCLSILRAGLDSKIVGMLGNMNSHDARTYLHSIRFSAYLGSIVSETVTNTDRFKDIVTAGLLHDIGVSRIPSEFLTKEEWSSEDYQWFIKQHVEFAAVIFREQSERMPSVVEIVSTQHHERLDGSGPLGKLGENFAEFGRIAAVIEEFLSLKEGRRFGATLTKEQIFRRLYDDTGLDQRFVHRLAEVQSAA
ncbi:MAG: response regulator [Azospirillum sp.]|nr:response regulator [Azospirillum sp.]